MTSKDLENLARQVARVSCLLFSASTNARRAKDQWFNQESRQEAFGKLSEALQGAVEDISSLYDDLAHRQDARRTFIEAPLTLTLSVEPDNYGRMVALRSAVRVGAAQNPDAMQHQNVSVVTEYAWRETTNRDDLLRCMLRGTVVGCLDKLIDEDLVPRAREALGKLNSKLPPLEPWSR